MLQIQTGSPPKRVNTTMSNYAAKNYQDQMDNRLSVPKRKTERFEKSLDSKDDRRMTTSIGAGSKRSSKPSNLFTRMKANKFDPVTIQPVPLDNFLRKERPKSEAKNRIKSSWVVA